MGNLQEKLKAHKIPHKDACAFWESFLNKFLELYGNKKVDKSIKSQLKIITKRLMLIPEDHPTFTVDLTPPEEYIKEETTRLFSLMRNESDRIGIALESLEFALKTASNIGSLILKACGFQYLEQVQFLAHRVLPKICSTLQLLDISHNPKFSSSPKWFTNLVDGLKNHCGNTIGKLRFNDVGINDDGIQYLLTFLTISKVRSVHLNHNDFTDSSLELLTQLLKDQPRISDFQVKLSSKISRDALNKFRKVAMRNDAVADIIEMITGLKDTGSAARTGSMRKFSVKMRQFNHSMRQRTKSDADSKQVPVYKWFSEDKGSSPSKSESSGISKRFKVGTAETIGKRKTMEDVTLITGILREGQNDEFFAVYDGHGGKDCADYASKHLPKRLITHLEKTNDPIKSLTDSFVEINAEMSGWAVYSGTTACTALFIDNKLYVANVGDTRAVLNRNGKAIRLSLDHRVDVPSESKRILDLGGKIENGRVSNAIAVTRSMGDSMHQPYLIAEPFISTTEISKEDRSLIIACDGLWDEIEDQAAIEAIHGVEDPQEAAEKLKKIAFEKGSEDNISVLVIYF